MPFVKTAFLDQSGAGLSEGSSGESVNHFTGVRLRVIGTGNLKMKMHSQDDLFEFELAKLPMELTTNIQPTRLCNFTQQRAQLHIYTDEKNEIFRINRVIVFAKSVFSSYPG